MSTFNGLMEEFPNIRVDYFRQHRPKPGQAPVPPALACFLSHVHSDHVEGLESTSFRSPFIYCSAATKELLLRLEKYPHRLNFALGILEAQKVHFKHLKNILKPIPLETPTRIELSPGKELQVTLFDANHCVGAVMFLFEGDGKAVLYTGDIRSEPWFVNNLTRNPSLIEYTTGLKTLDCIYLDTSNIDDIPFPTKAAGLKELLEKVSKYPPDTVFHFSAWTFGYEEVWMALSKALKSRIHVDRYKLKLYESLRGESNNRSGPFLAREGPILTGYNCGNTPQDGCLTRDTEVRLHSCEKGMYCSTINEKTVWIRPILARKNGEDILELGIGGGGGDLNQHPDLVLNDQNAIDQLMDLFENTEDELKADIKRFFSKGLGSTGRAISLDGMDFDREEHELPLSQMAKTLIQSMNKKRRSSAEPPVPNGGELPKIITFPYSRHSSYDELCNLVRAFRPKDVYPCTVHEEAWVKDENSIAYLFGDYCENDTYRHDREMDLLFPERVSQRGNRLITASQSSPMRSSSPVVPSKKSEMVVVRKGEIHTAPKASSTLSSYKSTFERQAVEFSDNNAQGRVDMKANNDLITPEGKKLGTPQCQLFASSPGSDSQRLRRKAIHDELGGDMKRTRFQIDGPDSSPPPEKTNQDSHEVTIISSDDSIPTQPMEEESDTAEDGPLPEDLMMYDRDEEVYRCTMCMHEVWGGLEGFCTGCEEGANEMPYYEVIDTNLRCHFRPDITFNEYTDDGLEGEARKEVVGDCLDDDSSAYDTQDSDASDLIEEYEVNSFIDDAESVAEEGADESNSEEDDEDYKAKYAALLTSNEQISTKYRMLEWDFREFRMDILGEDYDEDDEDDEERDENGMLIIKEPEQRVLVTDIILSDGENEDDLEDGGLEIEEIDEARIRRRVEVFEAVGGSGSGGFGGIGRGCNDVTLVSTGANHSLEEIEL